MDKTEFWNYFGLKLSPGWVWTGNREQMYIDYPPITLDSLFKYCACQLWDIKSIRIDSLSVWWNEHGDNEWTWCIIYFPNTGDRETDNYADSIVGKDKDSAQALYKAITELIKLLEGENG